MGEKNNKVGVALTIIILYVVIVSIIVIVTVSSQVAELKEQITGMRGINELYENPDIILDVLDKAGVNYSRNLVVSTELKRVSNCNIVCPDVGRLAVEEGVDEIQKDVVCRITCR